MSIIFIINQFQLALQTKKYTFKLAFLQLEKPKDQIKIYIAEIIHSMMIIINKIKKHIQLTKSLTFGMHYKEGQLKMLSNFINQYHQKGDKIQVSRYRELIKSPNPFLLRQAHYFQQFSNIFKNNVPYVEKNIHQFGKIKCIHSLLLMYQTLNIHRKGIFQLIAKKQVKPYFLSMNLKQLSYIYKVIIELHSTQDKQFLKFLKKLIFQSISQKTSSNFKQNDMVFLFNSVCTILKYNLMQKQFIKQQAQRILDVVQKRLIPNINHKTFFVEQSYTLLASLYQNIEIRGLTIKEQRLHSYFIEAEKIKIKKRYQRHKSIFLPNKQEDLQNEQKQKQSRFSTNNKKYFVEGQSIFEIIFSKFLDQFGYNFQQNLIIGSNQFDIVVKGKKQKKYMPFQNLMDQNLQFKKNADPITPEQWNVFKKMNKLSPIKINQKFQEPVILSLNGPSHYIDSDTYGINQVTRSQQMKKSYVKIKGYKRYATVNFRQWQKVHQEGMYIRQFIQKTLQNSKIGEMV